MKPLHERLPKTLTGIRFHKVDEDAWRYAHEFVKDHYHYTHLPHFAKLDNVLAWVWSSNPHLILHDEPDTNRTHLVGVAWWDQEDDFGCVEKCHILVHKRKMWNLQAYTVHALAYRFSQPDGPEFQLLSADWQLSTGISRLLADHPGVKKFQNCGDLLFSHLTRSWYTTDIYMTNPVLLADWLQGSHVKKEAKTGNTPKPVQPHWFDHLRRKVEEFQHKCGWRRNA